MPARFAIAESALASARGETGPPFLPVKTGARSPVRSTSPSVRGALSCYPPLAILERSGACLERGLERRKAQACAVIREKAHERFVRKPYVYKVELSGVEPLTSAVRLIRPA